MTRRRRTDLVDPITVIRRWGLVLIAATVAGGVLGGLYGSRVQSVYEANAVILVGPVVPDSDLLEGTTDLARTYGELLESADVIRRSTEGTGVSAGRVDVAAAAGRDSATISVRVRAPSRDATAQIVTRLLEVLQEIVAENRADVSNDIWGTIEPPGGTDDQGGPPVDDDPAATFPIGSAITVIDDGTAGIEDSSLGLAQGGLLGAMVAALVVSALALGVETRRAEDPLSRALVAQYSADLGRLPQLPLIPGFILRRRWRRAIPDIKRRRRDLRYTAEGTTVGPRAAPHATVFLAAPSSNHAYVRAAVQLCSGFDSPPILVDPTGVIGERFAPATFSRLRSERFVAVVDDRIAAELVRPDIDRRPRDPDEARQQLESLCVGASVVFIFVPVDSAISKWLFWATVSDRCIALVRPSDLRAEESTPFIDRIELAAVPFEGAVALSRRWLIGRAARVQVSEIRDANRSESLAQPVGQLT